jgi:CsoR family transcriptional regulator, copper-sensing transcriptional repressor
VAESVTERERQEIVTRLKRVEGQIRGIQRMIEEQRDCEAIAAQLLAARAALDKVSLHVMTHHIEMCLRGSSDEPDQARLDRIIAFFLRFSGQDAMAELAVGQQPEDDLGA